MADIPELAIPPIKPQRFADLLLPPGARPTIPYLPADQATRPLGPVIAPVEGLSQTPDFKRDDTIQGKPGPVEPGPVRPRILRLGSASMGGTRITPEERDLLIRTMVGEAEGEGDVGMQAVANSVLNRLKAGRYGRDIKSIVLAPRQYSTWNSDKLYGRRKRVESLGEDDPLYTSAGAALDKALAGDDPTKGATHFLNPVETKRIRKKGDLPAWAVNPLVAIGAHEFYAPTPRPGQAGVLASGEGVRDLAGAAGVDVLGRAPDAGQSYLLHRTQAGADDLIAKEEARQKARQMLKAQGAQGIKDAAEATAQPPGADYYGYQPPGPLAADPADPTGTAHVPTFGEVYRAVIDTPMQAVGGVFDAVRNTVLAGDSLADWLDTTMVSTTGGQAQEGGPLEWLAGAIDSLNPAGEARTETGKVVRSFTNFVAGFARAMGPSSKLGKAVGLGEKGAKVAGSVVAGAAAGSVAMDPFQPGIANLVQEFPALQNPITEYLTVSPDDTEGEARLKHALEEAGFGVLTEGLLIGLRAARDWHAARRAAKPTDAAAQAAAYGTVKPADFAILGDPTKPILSVGPKVPRETAKLKAGETATAGVPASDLAAAAQKAGLGSKPEYQMADEIGEQARQIDMEQFLQSDAYPVALTALRRTSLGIDGGLARFAQSADELYPVHDLMKMAAEAERQFAAGTIDEAQFLSRMSEALGSPVTFKKGALPVTAQEAEALTPSVERLGSLGKGKGFDELPGEAATAGKGTDVPLGATPRPAYAPAIRLVHPSGETEIVKGSAGQIHADLLEQIDPQRYAKAKSETGFLDENGKFITAKEAAAKTGDAAAAMLNVTTEPAQEIFINFSRIDTADDVKGVIRRMATTFSGQIDEGRRGVQSFEDTKALADELGMTVPDLLSRRQGQPFNAEEALAARRLWAASAEKLLETAKAAAAPNAGAIDQFNFRRMMAIHYAVQAEVIGARTETARALSAWRIPAGGGTEQARAIQQTIDGMGGAVASAEMAKRLTMLSEAGVAPEAINTFARKGWAATSVDAIREFWVNALLSSPTTHIVNTTSNTLVAFQTIMERKAAEGVGALRGSGDGVAPGEAAAMAFGMVGAVKDAFRLSWKALKTGENIDLMGKVDTGPTPAISSEAFRISSDTGLGRAVDFLGATVRVPGRALGAEDVFFKTIGYRMNLRAEALRMAYGEGKRGSELAARVGEILKDAPEHLKISAADAALYQTFTNETGKFGKGLLSLRASAPVVGFVLPFIKTPLNITRYAFERSPLAPLVGQWRADIAAGGARRDLALARMATGSTVMLATMDYADRGLISGAGPDDPGEREALLRQGWAPYSMKIGDAWYSYNRMDPLGMTLGFAADMTELIKRGEIEAEEVDTVNEVIAASIAAVSLTVTDKTYMEGVAQFVDMFEDPTRYAPNYIDNFLGSFVPAGAAAAERIIDPAARERMKIGDAVYDRIAGLSDSLPPKRDLWGKIMQPNSGMGPAFDALSPVRVSKVVASPIDAEMTRLNMNEQRLKKGLNWDGVDVNLRDWPDVFDAYVRLAGNELKNPGYDDLGAKDFLDRIVTGKHDLSEIYKLGSEGKRGGKADFISKTIQEYRQLARDAIMADPKFADFAAWVEDKKAAQDRKEREAAEQ